VHDRLSVHKCTGKRPASVPVESGSDDLAALSHLYHRKSFRPSSHQESSPPDQGCVVERFHQTLKYEEVWGAMYENPFVVKERIEDFRRYYDTERIHQTLDYRTPLEVIEEYKTKLTYSVVA